MRQWCPFSASTVVLCVPTVCSPPCLPVDTAPGSKTCQDAQHKLFVLQFHWRTELFFSLNWGWLHCWLSAAVPSCESPMCGCTHLAAEKLWSLGRALRSHLVIVIWGRGLCIALCSSDMHQHRRIQSHFKLSFLRKLRCSVPGSPPSAFLFPLLSLTFELSG